ncbi:ribosomal protein S18 acetylase RimI-like enzyme [Paenibacillus sp. BK033]|uniref:GNAT family N-acetyltransferase n=1 Tax=Paenibacillus sp. BK033 TaxID=2512133 RepID=UPI0010443516|nr:GNAT family N-acetyltransferase [Paenibacillus sp. BK033]TCM96967.1 ribosomal protein S18 acetylase RimI-like enzyme [Paenibacillus sp. BK033]
MTNITIEVVKDGNIEPCRELCNELMAFQKSRAVMAPEVFDWMNFDTRMRRSYDGALHAHVLIARDEDVPVGYAFSTIEDLEPGDDKLPAWAPNRHLADSKGFYPDWVELPKKIGFLSNLYLRDGYRSMGLGAKLFKASMEWLESFPDVDLLLIYVSNGNEDALQYYLKHGFTYSHDVFGGFIKAVYKKLSKPAKAEQV